MQTRTKTIASILAVLYLPLAACGGGGDKKKDDGNGDNGGTQDTGVVQDTEMPDDEDDTGMPEDTGEDDEDTSDEEPDTTTGEDTTTEEDTTTGNDTGPDTMDGGGAPDTTMDGGGATDTTMDGGGAPDTTTDGGGAPDTTTDGGGAPDTGPDNDGGPAPDTGPAQDGGPAPDTMADSGTPDTGPARDGGPAPDTMADGGTPDTGPAQDGGPAPDVAPTESSIRSIRQKAQSQNLQVGSELSGTFNVDDVVVTAIKNDNQGKLQNAYVQEPSGSKANSGLYVYFQNAKSGVQVPTIERGDVIDLEGKVLNYDNGGSKSDGGLLEINELSGVQVVNQNGTIPSPVVVGNPSEISTGGARADELESVLVRLENVDVTKVTEQGGQPKFGEITLEGGAIVDAELYEYFTTYKYAKGTTYTYVQGPLTTSFDTKKIIPRDKNDIDGPTQSGP